MMELTKEEYRNFVEILKEELTPAFGCTEPIAIAYCAAKARETLGCLPEKVVIEASGNIIKNVKSVIVPNTGRLKGIPAAAAAGIVAGEASKILEVIAQVSDVQREQIREYLEQACFVVKALESGDKLDVRITVSAKGQEAVVRIAKCHSNIVRVEKNGEVLLDREGENCEVSGRHSCCSDLAFDGIGACPSHLQEPVRAVMPHSRQNNAHGVAFCHIGNGAEQDVNGGPVAVYLI